MFGDDNGFDFLSERYVRVICKDCSGSFSNVVDHFCFPGTNVSLTPDGLNFKMYSRNKENLVQSENDFVGSHGFQHGTKRGVGIQSSLTEYKKKKKKAGN